MTGGLAGKCPPEALPKGMALGRGAFKRWGLAGRRKEPQHSNEPSKALWWEGFNKQVERACVTEVSNQTKRRQTSHTHEIKIESFFKKEGFSYRLGYSSEGECMSQLLQNPATCCSLLLLTCSPAAQDAEAGEVPEHRLRPPLAT